MQVFQLFANMQGRDYFDILIMGLFFYLVFMILKESRSFVALRALVAVVVAGVFVWAIAKANDLAATPVFLERCLLLVVIVFTIIFQTDFRKSLTEFGQTSVFRPFLQTQRFEADEIVKAAVRMGERRIGALIAIERRSTLRPYVEVGTQLDAQISAELLRTIFALQTPLHDGAVIIRSNRIAAAGCLLPLSENPRLPKDLGTRHRAAIGLVEETDAVVIVCSEETGIISLAHDGKFERNETAESLRAKLRVLFASKEDADV